MQVYSKGEEVFLFENNAIVKGRIDRAITPQIYKVITANSFEGLYYADQLHESISALFTAAYQEYSGNTASVEVSVYQHAKF